MINSLIKVILIHGNGGATGAHHWFPYVKKELEDLGVKVLAPTFPDNELARKIYWMPFLKSLNPDENTILIGHSSGAILAVRYAEENKILGSVLVGGYHTDLGLDEEKQSGYFDAEWDWNSIKNNQKWIIQFNSKNDPWIPIEEARYVHEKLNTEYYESETDGHFGGDKEYNEFPKLVEVIKSKL